MWDGKKTRVCYRRRKVMFSEGRERGRKRGGERAIEIANGGWAAAIRRMSDARARGKETRRKKNNTHAHEWRPCEHGKNEK